MDRINADIDSRLQFATAARLRALARWNAERTPQSRRAYYEAYVAWLRCFERIVAADFPDQNEAAA